MRISESVREQLSGQSWIRKMFEEAARLAAERGPDSVFDFSLGNPEVEPPQPLLDSLMRAVIDPAPGLHSYMPNAGYPHVREAIARHLRERTGLPYEKDHVVMTVGAAGAINAVLRTIVDPGDEVIVLSPYFVEYRFYVANFHGQMVLVETDDRFQLDVERIVAAITPRTRAILLNSPNNPTGVIYPGKSLASLEEGLRRFDQPIVVISDEPYRALTFDGRRTPEVPNAITRTVIATSWSKALAIPGERIGYLAVSPRIEDAASFAGACTFSFRVLGYVNAPALWQRAVAEVPDLTIDVGPYQAKRDMLCDGLESIGYRLVRPEGAFYVFPRTPIDDVEFVSLLHDEGILAVPGVAFGRPGHMRLSLTVSPETIERALPGFQRAHARAVES